MLAATYGIKPWELERLTVAEVGAFLISIKQDREARLQAEAEARARAAR